MYEIDEQKKKRREKMLEEHKRLHRILADLHSIASLAPRIHLSNDIGTTKTDVDYPSDLSMKLAKEAVRIATERLRELESELWPDPHSDRYEKMQKAANEMGTAVLKEMQKRKYGNILAGQPGIYTNPAVMDVLESVMDEISDLGWLDILDRHQPKEEKANK